MSPVRSAPNELRANDVSLRAQYLAEVLDLLYPDHTASTQGGEADFFVVPHARRPRMLVPAGDRRMAANAISQLADPRSRRSRLMRNAAVVALRAGAGRLLLRDRVQLAAAAGTDNIDGFLRQTLGEPFAFTVHIGPARPNRKPVLRLLNSDGGLFAIAKLGPSGLTRHLVRAETTALTALAHANLAALTTPRVLHAGPWRDCEVLIQSALPVWQPRLAVKTGQLTAAMREVADCCGVVRSTLQESRYWQRLRGRLETLADVPEGRTLARVAANIDEEQRQTALRFGSWHGDWTAWNSSAVSGALLVWDWERFATGIPVGFDALHYALHQAAAGKVQSADDAVAATMADAPGLLFPFGIPDNSAARVVARLYLLELGARYVGDLRGQGGQLGVLSRWLLPAVLRELSR